MQLSAKRAGEGSFSFVAFIVGAVRYALDISHVREIVTPLSLTHFPHARRIGGCGRPRSEVVPIINLRARFNSAHRPRSRPQGEMDLGVRGGKTVGLVVDDVLGVLRVRWGSFGPPPSSGAANRRAESPT